MARETKEEKEARQAAEREAAVRRAQQHSDRGRGCGRGKRVSIILLLFSAGCLITEGAKIMAEHNTLY